MTPAFKLAAKVIIHAVGPRGSDRPDLLASCYRQSLLALTRCGLRSIAFPCISTGVYDFDFQQATEIGLSTVRDWLGQSSNWSLLDRMIFAMYSQAEEDVYASLWETYFPSRAEAPVRAVTASAATPRRPPAAVDLGIRRPSISGGRGNGASPASELDIRPGAAMGQPRQTPPQAPARSDRLRAAAIASRTPSASGATQDATAAAASPHTTTPTSASTATTTPVPAPQLTRPDPGTDPGEAAGAMPLHSSRSSELSGEECK